MPVFSAENDWVWEVRLGDVISAPFGIPEKETSQVPLTLSGFPLIAHSPGQQNKKESWGPLKQVSWGSSPKRFQDKESAPEDSKMSTRFSNSLLRGFSFSIGVLRI